MKDDGIPTEPGFYLGGVSPPVLSPSMAAFLWSHGLYYWGMDIVKNNPNYAWWGYFDGRQVHLTVL